MKKQKTKQICVRVTETELQLIEVMANFERRTTADFIRLAIHSRAKYWLGRRPWIFTPEQAAAIPMNEEEARLIGETMTEEEEAVFLEQYRNLWRPQK